MPFNPIPGIPIQRQRRSPSPVSDLTQQRWMVSEQRRDNDALERLAEQEAQREEERLRARYQPEPQVIDLADSDDESETQRRKQGSFRVRIPSPPRLSAQDFNSWSNPAAPLNEAYENNRRGVYEQQPQNPFPQSNAGPPAQHSWHNPRY